MRVVRRNVVLAGVVAVLAALEVALHEPGPESRVVGPLLPGLDPRAAARVVVGAGGARVELARRGEGWILPGSFDHPARGERVEGLLDRLAGLDDGDVLSDDASRAEDYGLGEGATSIEVFDASGARTAGLLQGISAPGRASGAPGTFVRPLDADRIYRAARLRPVPVESAAWLDARLASFEPALVRGVRALGPGAGPAGELALEREGVDRWHDAAGSVPTRAVRALLERLRALFVDEVVAARPGPELDAPDLEVVLALGPERTLELRFATLGERILATRVEHGGGEEQTDAPQWVVRLDPGAYELVRDGVRLLAERPR